MDNAVNVRKSRAAALSISSNVLLIILKVAVGILTGSVSIISEAIHSGVDLFAAAIAFFAVRTASKPADADHPFGHGKAENISGTIEALLILAAAAWIVYEACKKLIHPEPVELAGWGSAVMFASALVNGIVSAKLFEVGKETDSVALQADALHLRTDVYTSTGVMFGLLAIWSAGAATPSIDIHWLDPAAAIAVAILIAAQGWRMTVQAGRDLMDVHLPQDELNWLHDYISRLSPTIRGYHGLRTRKSGALRFIDFHLLVESEMSVQDSHRITDVMTCDIEARLPGSNVTIHVEPCDGTCPRDCLEGCLITDGERNLIRRMHGLSPLDRQKRASSSG